MKKSFDQLYATLQSNLGDSGRNASKRIKAIYCLAELGDPRAVPILASILARSEPLSQYAAAAALAHLGGAGRRALFDVARTEKGGARELAVARLKELKKATRPSVPHTLQKADRHTSAPTRGHCSHCGSDLDAGHRFGCYEMRAAVMPRLAAGLRRADLTSGRDGAVDGCRPNGANALIRTLADTAIPAPGRQNEIRLKRRADAAKSLGRQGDQNAIVPLVQALFDGANSHRVNLAIVDAILKLDRPIGLECILPWYLSQVDVQPALDWSLFEKSLKSLSVGGYELVEGWTRVLGMGESVVRLHALEVLARLRAPQALMPMVGAITDASPRVRRRAIALLPRMGFRLEDDSISALAAATSDDDGEVRAAAVNALILCAPHPSARSALVTVIRQRDASLAELAMDGLANFPDDPLSLDLAPNCFQCRAATWQRYSVYFGDDRSKLVNERIDSRSYRVVYAYCYTIRGRRTVVLCDECVGQKRDKRHRGESLARSLCSKELLTSFGFVWTSRDYEKHRRAIKTDEEWKEYKWSE